MLDRVDVLTLFGRQFAVASSAQLEALGLARSTIRRAVQREVLVRLLPGVFTLAGQPVTFGTNAMAAQLYFGEDSYLTGATAGALHGFRGMPSSYVEIATRERGRRPTPKWVRHTWTPGVDAAHVTRRPDGLRVADPHVALVVLAARFNAYRFARAAEDAWHRKLITPQSLGDHLAAHRGSGHPGVRRVDEWLCGGGHRPRPSQSQFERDVIDALLAAGLPDPERQHPLVLPSGELIHLDIAWIPVMFAVEPGHSWFHGGDHRMAADAARDRACGEIGWHVSRYTEQARRDLRAAAIEVKRTYDMRWSQLRPDR